MGSSSESFYDGTTTGQHMDTTTPVPTTTSTTTTTTTTNGIVTNKPIILHLGDPIRYNCKLYSQLSSKYQIINPSPSSLEREAFKRHLQEKTWGDFSATIRPFWNTGGAMGSWDRELIELLPASMRVMASAGAGFDWVNTETLAEFGILYCNGAHASTESVAIMALYQIISVFRHMTRSALAARSNSPIKWREAHEKIPFVARDPTRHTLGIIGLGNIGHAVARKVKAAFDMEIIYHDVFQKTPELERQVDATYYPTLEAMLPRSDCVLIATPHTGRPLLNARTLALLPAGARVVNIARGICIDEDALADALESQHISAAGLDVHAHEPNVSPRLSKMDNVTLTSHTGGGSIETAMEFERLVMQNVDAVLQGRPALTAVNQGLVDGCLSRKRNGNGVVVNGGAESLSTSTNGEALVNGVVANGIGKVNGSASTAVGNT